VIPIRIPVGAGIERCEGRLVAGLFHFSHVNEARASLARTSRFSSTGRPRIRRASSRSGARGSTI